jgi:isopentenyl-diphosphate delta-isomerase
VGTIDDCQEVVLVDENGRATGRGEKIPTHLAGTLHRAFSVFVFNSYGQLLLQQRALTKYHSPGLWSNTCCGHPRPDESVAAAAHRRLREEMGFDCNLTEVLQLVYNVEVSDRMVEHEYDHILIGECNAEPLPNRDEVASWKWIDAERVRVEVLSGNHGYTAWLRIVIDKVLDAYFQLRQP